MPSQLKSGGAVVGGGSRQGSLTEQPTLEGRGLGPPTSRSPHPSLLIPAAPLTYDLAASGGSSSSGSGAIIQLLAVAAAGASTSSGSGALSIVTVFAIAASGASTSGGSGALLMLAALAATGSSTSAGSGALQALMALAAAGAAVSTGSGRIDFPPKQDFEEARLAAVGVTAEVRTF